MSKRFNWAAFAAIAIVGSAAGTQSAFAIPTSLVENFDELTPALDVTSAGAFTALAGTNVDIVGPANGYGALCAGPESGNCLDLGGTGGNPNGIVLANSLAAGTYFLSFDLVGSGRGQTDATTVTFGDYSAVFTLTSGDTTDGIVTNAIVHLAAPGGLEFVENALGGDGNIGNVLDNVVISPTAVPEPASLALLGGGLMLMAGFAGMWRRRKN